MEVILCVPRGTNIAVIQREYPDIYQDEGWDDHDRYFIGRCSDDMPLDPDESEWMTYDECVIFCGYADGAIDGADTLIDGNGEWAQGEVTKTDLYQHAHKRGIKSRR